MTLLLKCGSGRIDYRGINYAGGGDIMENPFFDHPILNSPYEIPRRHWELDKNTKQPTQLIINKRRPADFYTPIPKPKAGYARNPNFCFLLVKCVRKVLTILTAITPTERLSRRICFVSRVDCARKRKVKWLLGREEFRMRLVMFNQKHSSATNDRHHDWNVSICVHSR
jgi:hypothetical protein